MRRSLNQLLLAGMLLLGTLFFAQHVMAEENATLKVNSTPKGAHVVLGGRQVGVTPIELSVPAGRTIKVTIKADGYVSVTKKVTVEAGKTKKVDAKLKKMPKK